MCATNYSFRPAQAEDLTTIWLFLHAECQNPDLEQIRNQLPQLYVLFKNRTMIGILYRNPNQESSPSGWLITHPLYPTQMVQELMLQSFPGSPQTTGTIAALAPRLKPSPG